MRPKAIARQLLPGAWYDRLRRRYHRRRRSRRERLVPLTLERLRAILADELGVGQGAVVFAHISLNGMNLAFPFSEVLPLLREMVGPQGTLLFPSTHLRGRAEPLLRQGLTFDARRSITTMGVIAELARRLPGAVRSLHPTNSVAALGPLAQALTATHSHSIYPCGAESPYYKITAHAGRIVGLGVSTSSLTFVHCVEDILQAAFPVETRGPRVYTATVRDMEGREQAVQTLAAHRRIRHRDVPGYMRRHVPPQIARDVEIDGASYFTAQSRELYDRMEELARGGITIYKRYTYRRSPLTRWL